MRFNFIHGDVKEFVGVLSADLAVWDQPYQNNELWKYMPNVVDFNFLIVLSDSRRIGDAVKYAIEKKWNFVREYIMDMRSCYRSIDGVLDSHKTALLFSNGDEFTFKKPKYNGVEFHSCVHTPKQGSHSHSKNIDFFESLISSLPCYTTVDFFTGGGSVTIGAIRAGNTVTTIDINKTCGVVLKNRIKNENF